MIQFKNEFYAIDINKFFDIFSGNFLDENDVNTVITATSFEINAKLLLEVFVSSSPSVAVITVLTSFSSKTFPLKISKNLLMSIA